MEGFNIWPKIEIKRTPVKIIITPFYTKEKKNMKGKNMSGYYFTMTRKTVLVNIEATQQEHDRNRIMEILKLFIPEKRIIQLDL